MAGHSLQASGNLKLLAYLLARLLFLVRYCYVGTSGVGLHSRVTKWFTLGYIVSKTRRKGVSTRNKCFLLTAMSVEGVKRVSSCQAVGAFYSRRPHMRSCCARLLAWLILMTSGILFSFTLLQMTGSRCLSFLRLTSILLFMALPTRFYGDVFGFIWSEGFWGGNGGSLCLNARFLPQIWASFPLLFMGIAVPCFLFLASFWNSRDVYMGLLDKTDRCWS